MPILPVVGTEDPNGKPYTIEEVVGQAIGAASVCWENMSGTGVFQSDRAKQLLDEVMHNVDVYVNFRLNEGTH